MFKQETDKVPPYVSKNLREEERFVTIISKDVQESEKVVPPISRRENLSQLDAEVYKKPDIGKCVPYVIKDLKQENDIKEDVVFPSFPQLVCEGNEKPGNRNKELEFTNIITVFHCEYCGKRVNKISRFKEHLTSHFNGELTKLHNGISCPYCQKAFAGDSSLRRRSLNRHIGMSHDKILDYVAVSTLKQLKNAENDKCNKNLSKIDAEDYKKPENRKCIPYLTNNVQNDFKKQENEVKDVSKVFIKVKEEANMLPSFSENFCDNYKKQVTGNEALEFTNVITVFHCEYCDKRLNIHSKFKEHLISHFTTEMTKLHNGNCCPYCQKEFSGDGSVIRRSLNRHIGMTHDKILDYVSISTLKQLKKTETGKCIKNLSKLDTEDYKKPENKCIPFVTDVQNDCKKQKNEVKDVSNLSIKVNKEVKMLPSFYQNFCEDYLKPGNGNEALEFTNIIKVFHCQYCDKRFNIRSKFKEHLISHFTTELTKLHIGNCCPYCQKEFSGDSSVIRRSLNRHIGMTHDKILDYVSVRTLKQLKKTETGKCIKNDCIIQKQEYEVKDVSNVFKKVKEEVKLFPSFPQSGCEGYEMQGNRNEELELKSKVVKLLDFVPESTIKQLKIGEVKYTSKKFQDSHDSQEIEKFVSNISKNVENKSRSGRVIKRKQFESFEMDYDLDKFYDPTKRSKLAMENEQVEYKEMEPKNVTTDFDCEYCGKRSNRLSSFKEHLTGHFAVELNKLHNGESCPYCSKEFAGDGSLIRRTINRHIGMSHDKILDYVSENTVKQLKSSEVSQEENSLL